METTTASELVRYSAEEGKELIQEMGGARKAWLKKQMPQYPDAKIVLVGHSRGGMVAVLIALAIGGVVSGRRWWRQRAPR